MIVGTLDAHNTQDRFAALCSELSVALSQSGTYAPAIILEAPHGAHQVASLALGTMMTQGTMLEHFVAQSNVLIITPDPQIETIKLEHVAFIQQHFSYKTAKETSLLAIIPDATQLSIPVQNALLKTTEELQAPHHIIFGVEQAEQLLPTIQSRCQRITLNTQDQETAEDIMVFWHAFLSADIVARKQLIDSQFSKKTKKGQQQRDRIEEYLIGLQKLPIMQTANQIKTIEYFRKICHTVNNQFILDSLLFL